MAKVINNRQTHLDSLRGIASLIIVFVHFLAAFYPYSIFGNNANYVQRSSLEDLLFYPPFGLLVAGQFSVCLFFILSGYVLSINFIGKQVQFLKLIGAIFKRPFRLGGLVLFTIIISSILWKSNLYFNYHIAEVSSSTPWFSKYWTGVPSVKSIIKDILTAMFQNSAKYNPPLWTIKTELYGSCIVYLLLSLFSKFKYRLYIFFIILIYFYNSLYQGFIFGIIIADLVINYNLKSMFNKKILVFIFCVFIYLSSYPSPVKIEFLKGTIYSFLPNDHVYGGGYPMLSAFLLFLIVTISDYSKRILNIRCFKFLGKISYGLYSIHFLVLGSILSWFVLKTHIHIGYGLSVIVAFFAGLPIMICLSYLVTKYIDNPSIKLASYISNSVLKLVIMLNPINLTGQSQLI